MPGKEGSGIFHAGTALKCRFEYVAHLARKAAQSNDRRTHHEENQHHFQGHSRSSRAIENVTEPLDARGLGLLPLLRKNSESGEAAPRAVGTKTQAIAQRKEFKQREDCHDGCQSRHQPSWGPPNCRSHGWDERRRGHYAKLRAGTHSNPFTIRSYAVDAPIRSTVHDETVRNLACVASAAKQVAEKCPFGPSGVKTPEGNADFMSCLKARPTNRETFSAAGKAVLLARSFRRG